MATAAQVLANQANAQHSTGPKTAEGKARATRNNIKHGLCFGLLVLTEAEQTYMRQFEARMRPEMQPDGAIEEAAFAQFLDAVARLHKIRNILGNLTRSQGEDPLVVPDLAPEWNQLHRYRAAAEMQLYRAVNVLIDLQTARLYRAFHVTKEEQEFVPPLVKGSVMMWLDQYMKGHNDRELFYAIYDVAPFIGRLPKLPPRDPSFTGANPIAA